MALCTEHSAACSRRLGSPAPPLTALVLIDDATHQLIQLKAELTDSASDQTKLKHLDELLLRLARMARDCHQRLAQQHQATLDKARNDALPPDEVAKPEPSEEASRPHLELAS